VLLGLLPGLRQLRAPFITGALYLVVAWSVLYGWDRVPATQDSDAVRRLVVLTDLLGPGATLAAAGLCAYLLGTFLVLRTWPQFFTLYHWRLLAFVITPDEVKKWWQGRKERTPLWRRTLRRFAFWSRWRVYEYSGSQFEKWRSREDPFDFDRFDPVYKYERADGLGTYMAMRRTHAWAGQLDYWVYRQMDNLHRRFTYGDLKAMDPPDYFWSEVHMAWSEFRDFTWRRANNEFEYRGGNWTGGRDISKLPSNVSEPLATEGQGLEEEFRS
jgi:hypothetical protein